MKKTLLIFLITFAGAGLIFAETEFRLGGSGGFGNVGTMIVPSLQLGYISPSDNNGEEASIRWGILFDAGMEIRYKVKRKDYTYIETTGAGNIQRFDTTPDKFLDFGFGLLGEFYFLPWLGIAAGGGYHVIDRAPYVRVEIPFLFRYATLGVGYDYLFWKGDDIMDAHDISMPPGWRVNIFVRLRGEAAWAFLKAWRL